MTKNNIEMLNQKLDLLMAFNKEKLENIEAHVKATNGKIAVAQLKIKEIEINQTNCVARKKYYEDKKEEKEDKKFNINTIKDVVLIILSFASLYFASKGM